MDDNYEEEKRIEEPKKYFEYLGSNKTIGNSNYQYLHCPPGFNPKVKLISCHDRSRQNLKKHKNVSC